MKCVLRAISALTLLACSQSDVEHLPVAPDPPVRSALLTVFGYVVDEGGVCIADATVTVVRGQGLGQRAKQVTPCDAWDYGNGFVIRDLTPGVELTIQASAPGYAVQERVVVPAFVQTAVVISPPRIP